MNGLRGLVVGLLAVASPAYPWGWNGHAAVGLLGVEQAAPETRERLATLLGDLAPQTLGEACNWPDLYRDLLGGGETAPLHYVNLPPEAEAYLAPRDCPGGRCLPAALVEAAGRLGDRSLEPEARARGFAYLCHFAGDLHQPLHVGYAYDQGGNLVSVTYRGAATNLHRFWDTLLIERHAGDWQALAATLRDRPDPGPPTGWRPADVPDWVNESFTFTRWFAYPPSRTIDPDFEQAAWRVTRRQLDAAGSRLAGILNAVLAAPEQELGSE